MSKYYMTTQAAGKTVESVFHSIDTKGLRQSLAKAQNAINTSINTFEGRNCVTWPEGINMIEQELTYGD